VYSATLAILCGILQETRAYSMLASEIKRAKEISASLKGIGIQSSKDAPKIRAYSFEAPPPSTDTLQAIIEPLVRHHVGQIAPPQMEITPEMVKQIVQIMHSLPEADKLEVSKGIRNANSFIYNGTKYGTHEMMHGGSAGNTGTTSVYNEVVAGSDTSWTLTHTPSTGTLQLYANGQRLIETVDFTISGSSITTISSWTSGTLLADYQYTS